MQCTVYKYEPVIITLLVEQAKIYGEYTSISSVHLKVTQSRMSGQDGFTFRWATVQSRQPKNKLTLKQLP